MSGPTRRYDGGNVNFLIKLIDRDVIDAVAEQAGTNRSEILRKIVADWAQLQDHKMVAKWRANQPEALEAWR